MSDYPSLLSEMRREVESLRRAHQDCPDPYYACGQAPGSCWEGDPCSCEADETNATVDRILAMLTETTQPKETA